MRKLCLRFGGAFLILLAGLILVSQLLANPASAESSSLNYVNNLNYAEGEVLAVIRTPASPELTMKGIFDANVISRIISDQADGFARRHRLTNSRTFPRIANSSNRNILHLRSESKTTEELIQELSSAPGVESVSRNYIRRVSQASQTIPNDPLFPRLWGMENIGMPQVWESARGSRSVYVAIFDTGIDYNHPDLKDNIARDSSGNHLGTRFSGNGEIQSGSPMDTEGHGTHVAGIIGAVGNNEIGVTGVNWYVSLLAINVMPDGQGYDSDIIAAIEYVLTLKEDGRNILVANMSFGAWSAPLPDNSPLGGAIKSLSDAGILSIFAAGNDNQDINAPFGAFAGRRIYPASFRFEHTISVGSVNRENTRGLSSNFGIEWVDIAAPGVNVYSTHLSDEYVMLSGTSMSAPHVAGAAALLFAAYPHETASQIRARLLSSARNIGVAEWFWANGILDVASAYNAQEINVPITVNGVTIRDSALPLRLNVGARARLAAAVIPAYAPNRNVTWLSSHPTVATVNAQGLVTAVSAGAATITVSTIDGGFTDTRYVEVTSPTSNQPSQSNGGSGCNAFPARHVLVFLLAFFMFFKKLRPLI